MLAILLAAIAGAQLAQADAPEAPPEEPPAAAEPNADAELGVLVGRWVRPDGGYTIEIKAIGADGKLDATYANPTLLPFAEAKASRDGQTVKVFLELRAGGYNGSMYMLTYDPAHDQLRGVYYQAVARQKFDVYFERAR
jgi:uncharacterized protein (DUF2147 family)